MPIVPPVFIRGDDLYIFASVADAESYLEPPDVEPDERGYDSEGRLLRVVVRRRGMGVNPWVELVLAEEAPSHAEELRAVLGDWLARAERVAVSPTASLPDLVERAGKHAENLGANPGRGVTLVLAAGVAVLLGLWWLVSH